MSVLAGKPLQHWEGEEAVKERRQLLDTLKCGVSDMAKSIRRMANNSYDENLELIEMMNVDTILEENPSLQKILFTSSSGKASAAGWFKEFLFRKGIKHTWPKGPKPWRAIYDYNGRKIELAVLSSPSPRAAAYNFEQLCTLYGNEILGEE